LDKGVLFQRTLSLKQDRNHLSIIYFSTVQAMDLPQDRLILELEQFLLSILNDCLVTAVNLVIAFTTELQPTFDIYYTVEWTRDILPLNFYLDHLTERSD
jgi:hypothetical protein